METRFTLSEDRINNIKIHESIFENEEFEYQIVHRESFIDELIRWISEAFKDKELMKQDLKMLMSKNDEYMFSSISTNDYILSDDERFDETCLELLKLDSHKVLELITFDMVKSLDYGDSEELCENYELYHYCDDDVIVLNRLDEEGDNLELFQIMMNKKKKQLVFETL